MPQADALGVPRVRINQAETRLTSRTETGRHGRASLQGHTANILKAGDNQSLARKMTTTDIIKTANQILSNKNVNITMLKGIAKDVRQCIVEREAELNAPMKKIYMFVMSFYFRFKGAPNNYKRELDALRDIEVSANKKISEIEKAKQTLPTSNLVKDKKKIPIHKSKEPSLNHPLPKEEPASSPVAVPAIPKVTDPRPSPVFHSPSIEEQAIPSLFDLQKENMNFRQALESVGIRYCTSNEQAKEELGKSNEMGALAIVPIGNGQFHTITKSAMGRFEETNATLNDLLMLIQHKTNQQRAQKNKK